MILKDNSWFSFVNRKSLIVIRLLVLRQLIKPAMIKIKALMLEVIPLKASGLAAPQGNGQAQISISFRIEESLVCHHLQKGPHFLLAESRKTVQNLLHGAILHTKEIDLPGGTFNPMVQVRAIQMPLSNNHEITAVQV